MEADLSRYHHIDLRDRWRHDENGRSLLTLRMLAVRIRHLPTDSAVAVALNGEPVWTRAEVLVADLWSVWAGKEHPAIAQARKSRGPQHTAEWLKRLALARARQRERKRQIEAGEIT